MSAWCVGIPSLRRIERDDLGAQRAAIRRHGAEESGVRAGRHDGPNRLHHLAAGERGEGRAHRRDQVGDGQVPADGLFVEEQDANAYVRPARK